ncbi:YggS family pyridoxal phosphate-dependent enzyme [Limnovirga soli]|uniref:Pyridoxal phosphate homeostasis protein n=1 Tax=Limnovirga soli TaxID=2656915 RepID=A0A8J8JVS2_9BACT|nr:YggS family pyridoxal phosphate-dependent enzyme [Limnovirga soli]NNV54576.1 YggS family pyridoxal phosphate-dependent enzyme [Limnovirga soli]
MGINTQAYKAIRDEIAATNTTLVAVSKTKPATDIEALYHLGQRDFGENYVQELVDKQGALPDDIRWHFIGHLQSNKVKYIAPFVHLIHGVDSFKLLTEINKQAQKNNRIIDCLLQIHIAKEETKFGFNEAELATAMADLPNAGLNNIVIKGFMGMASFTSDTTVIAAEFTYLNNLYQHYQLAPNTDNYKPSILSMGMSSDYALAIAHGSNMIRVGSLLFGERNYTK